MVFSCSGFHKIREGIKTKYVCDLCDTKGCEFKYIKQHFNTKKHKLCLDQINAFHEINRVSHTHSEINLLLQDLHQDEMQLDEVTPHQPPLHQSYLNAFYDHSPQFLQFSFADGAHRGFGNDENISYNTRLGVLDWDDFFLDTLAPLNRVCLADEVTVDENSGVDKCIVGGSWRPFPNQEVIIFY